MLNAESTPQCWGLDDYPRCARHDVSCLGFWWFAGAIQHNNAKQQHTKHYHCGEGESPVFLQKRHKVVSFHSVNIRASGGAKAEQVFNPASVFIPRAPQMSTSQGQYALTSVSTSHNSLGCSRFY